MRRLASALVLLTILATAPANAEADRVGISFLNVDVAANTLTQLIAPATNVNGLYIRTAAISDSGSVTLLYASATTPSAVRDLSARTIFESATAGNGGWNNLGRTLFVPAGFGLWLGATSSASIAMTYDLLN